MRVRQLRVASVGVHLFRFKQRDMMHAILLPRKAGRPATRAVPAKVSNRPKICCVASWKLSHNAAYHYTFTAHFRFGGARTPGVSHDHCICMHFVHSARVRSVLHTLYLRPRRQLTRFFFFPRQAVRREKNISGRVSVRKSPEA